MPGPIHWNALKPKPIPESERIMPGDFAAFEAWYYDLHSPDMVADPGLNAVACYDGPGPCATQAGVERIIKALGPDFERFEVAIEALKRRHGVE